MSKRVQSAAIIGGGIAGPVAALALRKAGIAVTVYESYPSPAEGLGGTIALAPNGVAALDIVGAGDQVRQVADPAYRQVMSVNGKRVPLPGLAGVEPLQVVRRSDLHRILHDRAAAEGVGIEHGKKLVSVREEPALSVPGAISSDRGRASPSSCRRGCSCRTSRACRCRQRPERSRDRRCLDRRRRPNFESCHSMRLEFRRCRHRRGSGAIQPGFL